MTFDELHKPSTKKVVKILFIYYNERSGEKNIYVFFTNKKH